MQYLFKPLRGKQRSLVDAAQHTVVKHEFEVGHVKHIKDRSSCIFLPLQPETVRGGSPCSAVSEPLI